TLPSLPYLISTCALFSRQTIAVSFCMLPPPPTSTLFPYTTLFRSVNIDLVCSFDNSAVHFFHLWSKGTDTIDMRPWLHFCTIIRSEEHTSELQSRFDLVCRLLLEKNNENEMP